MKLPKEIKEYAGTGVEALLELIPFAGGSLATILSSYRNDRKLKKITDSLESLAIKIQENEIPIDKLLTEDQVCELFERHLLEIGVTSDESKISYLKNSLNNSFISSSNSFEDKDLFFNILKNLTTVEIFLLKELYLINDPFEYFTYPSNVKQPNIELAYVSIGSYINQTPEFILDDTTYKQTGTKLESYFENKYKDKWPLFKCGCSLLDSKGLSNINNNFSNTVHKENKMKQTNVSFSIFDHLTTTNLLPAPNINAYDLVNYTNVKQTAFEASKTKFGSVFIKYVTS